MAENFLSSWKTYSTWLKVTCEANVMRKSSTYPPPPLQTPRVACDGPPGGGGGGGRSPSDSLPGGGACPPSVCFHFLRPQRLGTRPPAHESLDTVQQRPVRVWILCNSGREQRGQPIVQAHFVLPRQSVESDTPTFLSACGAGQGLSEPAHTPALGQAHPAYLAPRILVSTFQLCSYASQ